MSFGIENNWFDMTTVWSDLMTSIGATLFDTGTMAEADKVAFDRVLQDAG